MKQFSLFIILTMIGFGSFQDIDSDTPDLVMDPDDIQQFQLPMESGDYLSSAPTEELESKVPPPSTAQHQYNNNNIKSNNNNSNNSNSNTNNQKKSISVKPQRPKRAPEEYIDSSNEDWSAHVVDPINTDQDKYIDVISLIDSLSQRYDFNDSDYDEKRSFSPWGGKRTDRRPYIRRLMWTFKQDSQEPTKRVRFSPWGGKRSEDHVRTTQDMDVMYNLPVHPEITEFSSRYSSNVPHQRPITEWHSPLRILGLDTENRESDAVSIDHAIEKLPLNHPPIRSYLEMFYKKDGKRKVKFSAWGGKRSMENSRKEPTLQDVLDSRNDRLRYETVPYAA